jgi:threonine synthase
MKFVSTRGGAPPAGLSEAIRRGAAVDGGLYLPEQLPSIAGPDPDLPLAAFAAAMLAPFFAGDALEGALPAMAVEAFNFPAPLAIPDPARPGLRVLELFHGPTGAFKDFGARFLLACLDRLADAGDPLHVLVATSGDTGGAVGCAAEGRTKLRASILFPKGRVSPFQELQLTCWGASVGAIEVEGDFDDCQRLVKAAFADPGLAPRLTSANSINIGRLLPQMAYAGHAASRVFAETGAKPGFIVPTGNLGHGFAVLYARAVGLPIGPVVLATNANRALLDWQESGVFAPRASVATIANAMDVGAPGNFERLIALTPEQREMRVDLVEDEAIRDRIRADYRAGGYVWCPHSATAAEAYARLGAAERAARPWIACATAHPFKFADMVEPLIGRSIAPPPALAAILGREGRKKTIPAELGALRATLRA